MQTSPDDSSTADLRSLLASGLEDLSLEASTEQIEQLAELSQVLSDWGQRINLTAHRSPSAIARRLVLDAAAMLSVLPDLESIESLADLGSGAGFPGLPIAILRPETRVTLVEAREKRHHFQRAAIRSLGLANAEPLRGRIETLEPTPNAVVVAQAVGPWAEVIGLMIPWAVSGGLLVLPASREVPPPTLDSRALDATVLAYQVPLGGSQRQIWLARRA